MPKRQNKRDFLSDSAPSVAFVCFVVFVFVLAFLEWKENTALTRASQQLPSVRLSMAEVRSRIEEEVEAKKEEFKRRIGSYVEDYARRRYEERRERGEVVWD